MKFNKYMPCERLRPYIRHFTVVETELEDKLNTATVDKERFLWN